MPGPVQQYVEAMAVNQALEITKHEIKESAANASETEPSWTDLHPPAAHKTQEKSRSIRNDNSIGMGF